MASRAIDGVEMPGARVHNEILGQFHASLSQDEVCTSFPAPSPLSQPVSPFSRLCEHGFYQMLMPPQHPQAFLELLRPAPTSGGGLPQRCLALEFCRRVVQSEVDATGNPQVGLEEREGLLRDVIDVASIEACFFSAPEGAIFRNVLRKLVPLFEECRAAMRQGSDMVRACRGMEVLCLVFRAVRYKRVGMVGFIEALGNEYDGEQLVRSLIAQGCRVLDQESSSNFCCTLALKLLNVLGGCRILEKDGVIMQWLWQGGSLTVLARLLMKFRRFRHCLSLDTAVLQVCAGLHNLSAAASASAAYGELGDGVSTAQCMLSMLESAAVLGDVASNHMLMAKYRKANLLESVVLGRPAVHADSKAAVDVLVEQPNGALAGGQICYAEAFSLVCYYLSTRHRRQFVDAFVLNPSAAPSAAEEASDAPSTAAASAASDGEAAMPGPDGLPLVYGTVVLFLSLLLHKPTGAAARHAALVLSSLMPLAEEAEALAVLTRDSPSPYYVFSTDAATHPTRGVKEIGAGKSAVRALTDVLLQFMSDNMKLVLESDIYLACVKLIQRVIAFHVENPTIPLGKSFDANTLLRVFTRLLAYLAREAVWKANGHKCYALALLTANTLNTLVIFANTHSLLPPHAQLNERDKKAQADGAAGRDLTYPMLCYEIARCGCNNVFQKMLKNAKETLEEARGPEERGAVTSTSAEEEGRASALGSLASLALDGGGQVKLELSAAQKEGLQQLQLDLALLITVADRINASGILTKTTQGRLSGGGWEAPGHTRARAHTHTQPWDRQTRHCRLCERSLRTHTRAGDLMMNTPG